MHDVALILFDDAAARRWEPFALTRPAGELLLGAHTQRARAERALGLRCTAQLAAAHLLGFEERGAPPVRSLDDAPHAGARLFLSSRALPGWDSAAVLHGPGDEPATLRADGETVGWYLPAEAAPPERAWLDDPGAAPELGRVLELSGTVLRDVWELVHRNPDQIAADVAHAFPAPPAPELPDGVHRWGEHPLVLGDGVRLEPGCAIDTSAGPVWIDDGATVRAFTRLAGPAYIGPGSTVLGGTIEAVSLGPVCKVRGELAESVCLGYVNKAHDGHMGHAYLGRWVNLGAETTNSDLKNNYGTVRIWTPDGERDTGEIKMGCLLGDHVKTGIGLLLNTGTVVGAGSNLFGAEMPPKWVPPFSWGTGEQLVEYRMDKFLEVAERAMGRRDVPLPEPLREQLQRAWERGRESAAAAGGT